jgi:hypothetical protein
MTPNEQGRHCMSCQKTVIDFSLMSDQEVLHYISNASSQICGRFDNRQLNKTYGKKNNKKPFSWRYAWSMVVAAFLFTGNATMGQSKTTSKKRMHRSNKLKWSKTPAPEPISFINATDCHMVLGGLGISYPDPFRLDFTGIIVDNMFGHPVTTASVAVMGDIGVVPGNKEGMFSLPVPANKQKVTLVVGSQGYVTSKYDIPLDKKDNLKILLPPKVESLRFTAITVQPTISYSAIKIEVPVKPMDSFPLPDSLPDVTVGELAVTNKVSVKEKIRREIKEWLPLKEVRVYPNPVISGNSITVSMNLPQTGNYRMELMDASGRMVWMQTVQVTQNTQTTNLPTQSAWGKGIYWLRLSGGANKVYQAKVLLQ